MTEQIELAPPGTAVASPVPVRAGTPRDSVAMRTERERLRRARAAYEAKLSRLRLYSYCLTLTSCVLALMSFMYLTQGTADGDPTFVWLGIAFVAATVVTLWSAIRITNVSDVATA